MRPPPQSIPNPWWEREKRWRAAQREATSERPPRFAAETSGYGVGVRAMPRRIEMPRFWSHKRERQFEHIRNGLEERGESRELGRGDRSTNRQQGTSQKRRSQVIELRVNSRHFIRQERRASIASGTGWPDQAAAVRRSPPQGSQRTIDNEQGAARARREWALRAALAGLRFDPGRAVGIGVDIRAGLTPLGAALHRPNIRFGSPTSSDRFGRFRPPCSPCLLVCRRRLPPGLHRRGPGRSGF